MNDSTGAERLRRALNHLADERVLGRPDSTTDIVWLLAKRALSRASGGRKFIRDAVMDLVGSFHERLVRTASMHGGMRALAAHWCAKADRELLALVSKILFHLAVEAHPNWKMVRGLRILVSAAVGKGQPQDGATFYRPDTLMTGGRLNRQLVEDACRCVWLDAPASAALPWTIAALTPCLLRNWELEAALVSDTQSDGGSMFDALEASASSSPMSASAFDSVETTRALVLALKTELAVDERALLLSRAGGFKGAARDLGVGVATAHKRFQQLVPKVKQIVRALSAGPDNLEFAVAMLREEKA